MQTNISRSLAAEFNAGNTEKVMATISTMTPFEAALVVSDMREVLTYSRLKELTDLMRNALVVSPC